MTDIVDRDNEYDENYIYSWDIEHDRDNEYHGDNEFDRHNEYGGDNETGMKGNEHDGGK